jgi:hypothetical protein
MKKNNGSFILCHIEQAYTFYTICFRKKELQLVRCQVQGGSLTKETTDRQT